MQEKEIQKDNILSGFYALSISRPRRHYEHITWVHSGLSPHFLNQLISVWL